jgi:hypothetical protein
MSVLNEKLINSLGRMDRNGGFGLTGLDFTQLPELDPRIP